MSIRLAPVAAAMFALAVFTGIVSAAPAATSHTTTVAACEYTDQENCDYNGEY